MVCNLYQPAGLQRALASLKKLALIDKLIRLFFNLIIVQSIKDGIRHSRRTQQFYPFADLPRRPSTANYAVMLGSLSSVRHLQQEKMAPTCFWDWAAPKLKDVKARLGCVFTTAIVWNCIYSAPLFGFSSLRPILQEEGFFSDQCLDKCPSNVGMQENQQDYREHCDYYYANRHENSTKNLVSCKAQGIDAISLFQIFVFELYG